MDTSAPDIGICCCCRDLASAASLAFGFHRF